jgi:tetratricopeptide (TPR) repeat protein
MSVTTKWRYRAIAALFGAVGFVVGIGSAQASDDRDACIGAPNGDEKIAACTAAIAAGSWQGREFAPLYLNRGQAHLDYLDLNLALTDFNQAIRLDPALAAAYDGRGRVYQFHPERAIADYDEAIRLDPGNAKTYVHRGAAYRYAGDNERAIADFDTAIRIAPDNADAYRGRGMAYQNKGDLDRAIADFDAAVARNPSDKYAVFDRGTAYQKKGDFDRAIADYDAAIGLSPFTHAYEVRGSAYQAKGDLDRAIADYDVAIQRNPNDVDALRSRGLARQAKGDLAGGAADIAYARALSTVLGLSIPVFTKLHVAVSLIGIVSGFVVMLGMVIAKRLLRWTALFFASTALTTMSGLLLPSAPSSPSLPFGVLSLAALAIALVAIVRFRLAGHWRWVYVVAVLTALYLNVYVGIMEAIFNSSRLQLLLPRQIEPPFAVVTLTALAIFIVLGIGALRRFPAQARAA